MRGVAAGLVIAAVLVAPSAQGRFVIHAQAVRADSQGAHNSGYWVKEWRRRALREKADGQARARTIRRLRRTLAVRAWKPRVEGVWLALASCESGRRWRYSRFNHGARPYSGFDGGLQFHPGTWRAYRRPWEPAYAYEAPLDVQVAVARRVLSEQGWKAWPACSRRLGLR